MTPENFCYWLKGYIEIEEIEERCRLTEAQVELIQSQLELALTKTEISIPYYKSPIIQSFNNVPVVST